MRTVRIHERGNSKAITIPKAYLEELRWGLGDLLLLEVAGQELHCRALRGILQAHNQVHSETREAGNGAPRA